MKGARAVIILADEMFSTPGILQREAFAVVGVSGTKKSLDSFVWTRGAWRKFKASVTSGP